MSPKPCPWSPSQGHRELVFLPYPRHHRVSHLLESSCILVTIIKLSFCKGTSSSSGPAKQHKLFLTDGWECGFTGICIYMFRINNSKQLPEEGFHKDL